MKQYQLQIEHGGFPAGSIFEGPKPIPASEVKNSEGETTNTHTFKEEGYFLEGVVTQYAFCFYESYITNHNEIFKEVQSK